MKGDFHFSDNVRVASNRYGSEYLAVTFRDEAEPDPRSLWHVCVYRYCVPGRCDTYHFDWAQLGTGYGHRVGYFSEGQMPLPKALAMFARDLDRPLVIEMLCEAVSNQRHFAFSRDLVRRLLPSLVAGKHKGLRRINAAFERAEKERDAIIERRRALRLSEAREIVNRADQR